jgi:hypothetical protein
MSTRMMPALWRVCWSGQRWHRTSTLPGTLRSTSSSFELDAASLTYRTIKAPVSRLPTTFTTVMCGYREGRTIIRHATGSAARYRA